MEANAPTTRQVVEAVLLDESKRARLLDYACFRFGINRTDGEDLLQDTALELLRQRNYVRKPEGFVFVVFRARCARFIDNRRVGRELFSGTPVPELTGSQPSDLLDRQVALRQALQEISSACRRLLCAYYVEGQSMREAARRLSVQYSSVGKTMSRCLSKLRERLA